MLMRNHIRAAAHGRLDLSAIVGTPADLNSRTILFFESIMHKCFTAVGACQSLDTVATIAAFIFCHLKSP